MHTLVMMHGAQEFVATEDQGHKSCRGSGHIPTFRQCLMANVVPSNVLKGGVHRGCLPVSMACSFFSADRNAVGPFGEGIGARFLLRMVVDCMMEHSGNWLHEQWLFGR
jgi:hypothetical protein